MENQKETRYKESNNMENFLKINKDYFGGELKSIDLLILSQIEEFERNGCQCYVTNEQFSQISGESVSTVKRSLDKLENLGYIKRDTFYVKGHGRANRRRVLRLMRPIKRNYQYKHTNNNTINIYITH